MSLQPSITASGVGIVVALLLVLPLTGFCQSTSDEEMQEAPPEELEEIVVYGQRSLTELRLETFRAEDDFYDLFNSMNSDDEFDVHCNRETPTGSHIGRRVCRANYEYGIWSDAGGANPIPWLLRKEQLLDREILARLSEHPELLHALKEYSEAKRKFDVERKDRCGFVICR
jgi:hypothetical protein